MAKVTRFHELVAAQAVRETSEAVDHVIVDGVPVIDLDAAESVLKDREDLSQRTALGKKFDDKFGKAPIDPELADTIRGMKSFPKVRQALARWSQKAEDKVEQSPKMQKVMAFLAREPERARHRADVEILLKSGEVKKANVVVEDVRTSLMFERLTIACNLGAMAPVVPYTKLAVPALFGASMLVGAGVAKVTGNARYVQFFKEMAKRYWGLAGLGLIPGTSKILHIRTMQQQSAGINALAGSDR